MQLSPQGQLVPSLTDLPNQSAASFSQLCPFSPEAPSEDIISGSLFPEAQQSHPEIGRFLESYVGHVREGDFRARGSSGGMVNWILEELLRTGQIDGVAHVKACSDPQTDGRFFRYQISRTPAEIRQGAQSRYYPVVFWPSVSSVNMY
jgi:coenzyme F420-reducing hydrogenase beta subunit